MSTRQALGLCALIVAVLAARIFWPLGDEEQIARAVLDMCEAASSSGQEGDLVALTRARRVASHFVEDCEAVDSYTDRSTRGRRAVTRAVAWARAELGEVSFQPTTHEFELLTEGVAEVRVGLSVVGPTGPVAKYDGALLTMTWAEIDGRWQIAKVMVERGD